MWLIEPRTLDFLIQTSESNPQPYKYFLGNNFKILLNKQCHIFKASSWDNETLCNLEEYLNITFIKNLKNPKDIFEEESWFYETITCNTITYDYTQYKLSYNLVIKPFLLKNSNNLLYGSLSKWGESNAENVFITFLDKQCIEDNDIMERAILKAKLLSR